MTTEEAIKILEDTKVNFPVPKAAVTQIKRNIALDRAIDVLSNCSEIPNNWIPCSETVDIPDHEILACDKYGEEMFGYLAYEDEQWLCESDGCMMYDPIAWREKPEPYQPESEG